MLSNLPNNTVIGGRWKTVRLVGAGACAQVYSVTAANGPAVEYDIVAKVVPYAKGKGKIDKEQERICNTLNYEYMMYVGLLNGFPYVPRVPAKFYGNDDNNRLRYLVMEKLDRDLESAANDSQMLTPNEIGGFGIQILDGLQWIHNKNYLFVDVKPANFMLKGSRLYFVDCKLFCFVLFYIF
jgi:serine/threonine protein kinase